MNRILDSLPPKVRPWAAALLAVVLVLAGGGTVAIVTDKDGSGPEPAKPVVVVDPADPGPVIKAPAAQVERAAEQAGDGELAHEDAKGDALTDTQIARNEKVADRAGITGISPTLQFGASFEQRGCRTIPQGVNFSSRPSGVRPTLIGAAHITVSPEILGWGDVLGIHSFFGRLGTGASAHYIIDGEGHCIYAVPETSKAWTSGNMNPLTACNIEMIGNPDANGWMRSAGMAKAALVLRDCARRWGIPLQLGNTSGCNVLRAGLVDHNELECNNDHWDICSTAEKARTSGSDPCPLVAKILKVMRAGSPTLTALELKLVRSVRHPAGTGHTRRYWCRRIGVQLAWLVRAPNVDRQAARLRIIRRVWRESCTG